MSQFQEHHRKFHTLHHHSNHHIHKIKHHLHKAHHHTKNTIRFSALWLSILIIFLTIFFVKLIPHWQEQAQSNTNLICTPEGGMVNKLSSDRLNITNWKNQPVTIWIQYNICPFSGQLPYEGFQCNQFVNRTTEVLQAGETKTYLINIPNCKIGQLDINTVNPSDGGCYTPDNNLWSGGQAFVIKANPNCNVEQPNPPVPPNPPPATPSPIPTITPIPTLTPTLTPSPTLIPSPTPYIEVFFRTPRNTPVEKNVCVSSWITDQSGVFLNSTNSNCANRAWFSTPLQSDTSGFSGIYVTESNDINTLYFSPKTDSTITQHYPNGGLHYGWPRWYTGGRVITLIVNPTPTLTPTPTSIPTAGPSLTPRPTSSVRIKNSPTPSKDYYYHAYGNTITVEPTLKIPTKLPTQTATITPTKVPSKIQNISKYWPAAAVGIPVALMIIRFIL